MLGTGVTLKLKEIENVTPTDVLSIVLGRLQYRDPVILASGNKGETASTQSHGVGDIVVSLKKSEKTIFVAIAAPWSHSILAGGNSTQRLACEGKTDLEVGDFDRLEDVGQDLWWELKEFALELRLDSGRVE